MYKFCINSKTPTLLFWLLVCRIYLRLEINFVTNRGILGTFLWISQHAWYPENKMVSNLSLFIVKLDLNTYNFRWHHWYEDWIRKVIMDACLISLHITEHTQIPANEILTRLSVNMKNEILANKDYIPLKISFKVFPFKKLISWPFLIRTCGWTNHLCSLVSLITSLNVCSLFNR